MAMKEEAKKSVPPSSGENLPTLSPHWKIPFLGISPRFTRFFWQLLLFMVQGQKNLFLKYISLHI